MKNHSFADSMLSRIITILIFSIVFLAFLHGWNVWKDRIFLTILPILCILASLKVWKGRRDYKEKVEIEELKVEREDRLEWTKWVKIKEFDRVESNEKNIHSGRME